MIRRQLEEMRGCRLDTWLASQISFTDEELEGYAVEVIDGNDGAIYGYAITLLDGRTEHIGLPPKDNDEGRE